MPTRADSRFDFVRGFSLDVPEEAGEDEEEDERAGGGQELEEAAAAEEGLMLAGASYVAVIGMDDTLDMELDADADVDTDVDAADAEVDRITTAAQSHLPSRHLSRLRGKRMRGTEPEEDDAIGEWMRLEDLHTER
ncbi:hypothetical protein BC834DRAFT_920178 [Gloeopeniophorella convolvens]|nr:hypothetical protein BC834DRAFT_920178 [Gloeopeniophorella convolvens]